MHHLNVCNGLIFLDEDPYFVFKELDADSNSVRKVGFNANAHA